jgi:hypothetical protein
MHNALLFFLIYLLYFKNSYLLCRYKLDPFVYDVFYSESALELNLEVVTLTPRTSCREKQLVVAITITIVNVHCYVAIVNHLRTDLQHNYTVHKINFCLTAKKLRVHWKDRPINLADSLCNEWTTVALARSELRVISVMYMDGT